MIILGIETSCDETAVALYSGETGLIGHDIHSQVALHAQYGGVVPELASRDHIKLLLPLLSKLLGETNTTIPDIDCIAYTKGPGLAGALLVGASLANSLSISMKIPCIGIHHLEGHLLSPFLSHPNLEMPFLALLVSGGHTQIVQVNEVGNYRILGDTLDDAAGEAFDKTAKLLGLNYPGGAELSLLAEHGIPKYDLPRPMLSHKNLNFSFSGLKTAALLLTKKHGHSGKNNADIAASFQKAITDVLTRKTFRALEQTGIKSLVVAGGVSANNHLRHQINVVAKRKSIKVHFPPLEFCTDNAAMIAYAGYRRWANGSAKPDNGSFSVKPRWPLESMNY